MHAAGADEPIRIGVVRREIGERCCGPAAVPLFAVYRASVAPDADIEVYDEAKPLG